MRITPTQTSFAPDGPPPSFRIETDGYRFYAVQVTSDAVLLNGANASRRTQANFFDSWFGDAFIAQRPGSSVPRVAGQHLEAPTGRATYTLPQTVWERMRRSRQLFYRLIVSRDGRLRRPSLSVADVDALRAPSVSVAALPARPARHPVARFRGRNVLRRNNFPALAKAQMGASGVIRGRDGDFRFIVLDANHFDMTVLECHDFGLTDTVEKMPRKPDAIINGQFISDVFGIGTEGQVIREGDLINTNSQSARYYVAQTWNATNIAGFHLGRGNPDTAEPNARAAFGGLGPVLSGGAPISPLSSWAQSIYDRDADVGRGVIAIERDLGLILLLVQEDLSSIFSSTTNAMRMATLRQRLQDMGFDDAVFNDGSDSESLYAYSGWLLEPGFAKDEAMDFAISFVDRRSNRRFNVLAIDGTRTEDGKKFKDGISRPLITHYAPRNISDDLQNLPALSPIAGTFQNGIIEAWRATTQTQADEIGHIVELAGRGSHWADLFYVSSHAWRHGQLWYYANDNHSADKLMIADIWSPNFRPVWRTTPRWLILAGCAVLGLRYSRGLQLDTVERGHLTTWHQEMHGSGVAVPGLTPAKQMAFETFHPGWAWYDRVFRSSPGLRGVLGYWYRSPGSGIDEEIMEDFSERLRQGEKFLEAWEAANQRGWFQADAAWAGMVRQGCENDTLAALEEINPTPGGSWKYYDRFQDGALLPSAYRTANLLTDSEVIGSVRVQFNENYDEFAIDELKGLA
ncbi:MAG: hypothetical protein JNK38_06015, partial [Acidobacteria bacterium]|nr:hypothetical protein [Acidobacteriota bacterium]